MIFHAYVLIQLVLLARTAAAYDAAVAKFAEQDNLSPEANASLRQRLANTLFAQILAGSPREREGWFGSLLKAMAWITLVIAPILILLTFQFMFLPYHSHLATWTHRLLILLELLVAFQLWPLVLNPQRDFQWPNWRWRIRNTYLGITRIFRSSEGRRRAKQGLRQLASATAASILFVLLSLSIATFPGEPHVNIANGNPWSSVQCERWFAQRFDRLSLARVDIVDDEKLEKIEKATRDAGEKPYQGERTRILRDRDLNCGDFSDYADLRRVDFSGARFLGADLTNAKAQGASFGRTQLHGASLVSAQLQGAFLNLVELQVASLRDAQLQSASLEGAQLQGADFFRAKLQGTSLKHAQLQGASLLDAKLQGAALDNAALHGADLRGAELQGASLSWTQLQGTLLAESNIAYANLFMTYVWRAPPPACTAARVRANSGAFIWAEDAGSHDQWEVVATAENVELFIKRFFPEVSDLRVISSDIRDRLDHTVSAVREIFIIRPERDETDDTAKGWEDCQQWAKQETDGNFDRELAAGLRNLVCDAQDDRSAIADGIIRNRIFPFRHQDVSLLARGLLGEDGQHCAATKDLDETTKERLRNVIAATTREAPPH